MRNNLYYHGTTFIGIKRIMCIWAITSRIFSSQSFKVYGSSARTCDLKYHHSRLPKMSLATEWNLTFWKKAGSRWILFSAHSSKFRYLQVASSLALAEPCKHEGSDPSVKSSLKLIYTFLIYYYAQWRINSFGSTSTLRPTAPIASSVCTVQHLCGCSIT